jgi:hypothetical protein
MKLKLLNVLIKSSYKLWSILGLNAASIYLLSNRSFSCGGSCSAHGACSFSCVLPILITTLNIIFIQIGNKLSYYFNKVISIFKA